MPRTTTVWMATLLLAIQSSALYGQNAVLPPSGGAAPPKRPADFKPYRYRYTTEELRGEIRSRPNEAGRSGNHRDDCGQREGAVEADVGVAGQAPGARSGSATPSWA